jgi:hypothetical protein
MMAPDVGGEEERREMRREEEEVLWRTGVTAQVLSLLALLVSICTFVPVKQVN